MAVYSAAASAAALSETFTGSPVSSNQLGFFVGRAAATFFPCSFAAHGQPRFFRGTTNLVERSSTSSTDSYAPRWDS